MVLKYKKIEDKKVKIWIENNEQDLLAKGKIEFVEGEVDKNNQPTFFILALDENGKEFRVFLKAKDVKEHKQFIKDVELVLRH